MSKVTGPRSGEGGMWINPKSNFTRKTVQGAWESHTLAQRDTRNLEVADLALGLRKPAPKKAKAVAAHAYHASRKTDPYSS